MNIDGTLGFKYQGPQITRPFDFGTDAIERQRVSLGQSLIDADFEYGLQATKWQTYSEIRRFPSFYETPGTDLVVSNVYSDSVSPASTITVYTATPPPIGSVVTVTGLANFGKNADRAEGFFLVTSNTATPPTYFQYSAKGVVTGQSSNLQTSYTVMRRGGVFSNGNMVLQISALATDNTTNVLVTTVDPHGLTPGTPITVKSTGATFNGNFFVSNITSINTFNVVTSVSMSVPSFAYNSNIFLNPYSYAVHRPFDGGVLISPAQPSYGASILRQSKKTFRYQSGKGLLWSSGTLFCPNNDITSVQIFGTTPGSNIQVTCSIAHGVPQQGSTVILRGISVPTVINGSYTVQSVIDTRTINVALQTTLTSTNVTLADQPRFIMSKWNGASVRAGCFEDQNGLFWEYDGQNLFAVKRSSTFQITGAVWSNALSTTLTGTLTGTTGVFGGPQPVTINTGDAQVTVPCSSHSLQSTMYTTNLGGALGQLGVVWVISNNSPTSVTLGFAPYAGTTITNATPSGTFVQPTTRFQDQFKVNDKFTMRGMTHQVTNILGQGILNFTPPYRGVASISQFQAVQVCKIKEVRVPSYQFSKDPLDGTGPSGFKVDLTKMQMIGLQYTWYGAGFVDFMMRGADGNWVYAHRFRNNNINDEAYMRTGNMPVRYELINEAQSAITSLSTNLTPSQTTPIYVNDPTDFFPSAGTLMIDNELVSYSGKTSNSFTGITRAAPLVYNIADALRAFSGQPASNHNANTSVNLISTTCTPSLTHWGSALLMDGGFDDDRGYFFNYANTAMTITAGTTAVAFLIRLAPSVSNGIIGDIGSRDLLNRAQLLLQKLEVTSNVNVNTTGILNPTGLTLDYTQWQAINQPANGSQPSFAQVYTGPAGTPAPGERIFSSIVQANNQNNLDLSNLKEMANSIIGGNRNYPDGPDILCITVQNISTGPASVQCNLFWTEAQA